MKVVIVTTLWKRHALEACVLRRFNVIERVSESVIGVIAVGSEGRATEAIARASGVDYEEFPNSPLGAKHNRMLSAAKHYYPELDAVIVMGSDNWITDNAIDAYEAKLRDSGQLTFGVLDCYFTSVITGVSARWPGYPLRNPRHGESVGAGRIILREALERCDWKLWDDRLESRLDGSATARMRSRKITIGAALQSDLGVRVVDFKSGTNIWPMDAFLKSPSWRVKTSEALSGFDEREVAALAETFPTMLNGKGRLR